MSGKNILRFSLLSLFAAIIILGACTKDEDEVVGPSIVIVEEAGFISSDTSLKAGDEINLKVLLQGGTQNITNYVIRVTADGMETSYIDTGMNTASLNWHGTFFKTLAITEEWQLTVTDREGLSATAGFTISLDTSASYQSLELYPSVVLGAQDNVESGQCYNPYTNNVYFIEDVDQDASIQEGVEMIYYYFGDDKNVIASPGANIEDEVFNVTPADWTTVNTTRYIETALSAEDFNMAENDSIILANYNEGEAKRKAKKLQVNEVFTFRTQQGKLGMFLVKQVTGTNDGTINIDVKIQQ